MPEAASNMIAIDTSGCPGRKQSFAISPSRHLPLPSLLLSLPRPLILHHPSLDGASLASPRGTSRAKLRPTASDPAPKDPKTQRPKPPIVLRTRPRRPVPPVHHQRLSWDLGSLAGTVIPVSSPGASGSGSSRSPVSHLSLSESLVLSHISSPLPSPRLLPSDWLDLIHSFISLSPLWISFF